MKKPTNIEKRMDKLLTESINQTTLSEGKYKSEIMDFIDDAHTLLNKLSKDRSLDTKVTKQLFTKFRPLFDLLHSLVSTNETTSKRINNFKKKY